MPNHPPEKPTFLEQLQQGMRKAGWAASKGVAWWCLFWAALYTLLFALVGTQMTHPPEALLGVLAVLALASTLIGGSIFVRVRGTEQRETLRERLQRVVRLARAHEGILSVADVVAELGYTPDEATSVLRECSQIGIADVDADLRGVVIYRFHAYDKPLPPTEREPVGQFEEPEVFEQRPAPGRRIREHH